MTVKFPDDPQTHPWVQTFQWLTNPLEYMEACTKLNNTLYISYAPPRRLIS